MGTETITLLTGLLVAIGTIIKYLVDTKRMKQETLKMDLEIEQLKLENENLKLEQVAHNKEKEIHTERLSFYNDIIKLIIVNSIQDSVNDLFDKTTTDRVLILTAKNGKSTFKVADVIIDFFKNPRDRFDAVKLYSNVSLDAAYIKLLYDTENLGYVDIDTDDMQNQILKHFYIAEGVSHCRMLPIVRLPIDADNDFLVYVSFAKRDDPAFTETEKTLFALHRDNNFKPNIQKLLKNNQNEK